MRLVKCGLILIVLAGVGCRAPRGPLVVTHADPSIKIPAIKLAVQDRDVSAARQLVKDLESDDPAVRLFAIEGLQRLTGETFAYLYYGSEDQRRTAVEKWKAWLAGWEAGQAGRSP